MPLRLNPCNYGRDLQTLPMYFVPYRLPCPSRRSVLNEQLPLFLNLLMSKMLACSCQSVHQAPHYVLKYEIKELTEMSGRSLLSCLLQKSKFKIIISNNKALSSLQFPPLYTAECSKNLQKEKPSWRQHGLTHGLWQTLYHNGPSQYPLAIPCGAGSLQRPTAPSPGLGGFAEVPQAALPPLSPRSRNRRRVNSQQEELLMSGRD